MAQYTFDVKVFVEVTVEADTEAEALLRVGEDIVAVYARAADQGVDSTEEWPEAPFAFDGEPDLLRVDGEDV